MTYNIIGHYGFEIVNLRKTANLGRSFVREIHLVGSVPMASTEAVFRAVAKNFGGLCKRIPDGETAERSDWITWLEPAFANNPSFERSGDFFRVHESGTGRERYALKNGVSVADVKFTNLFYADIAIKSYRIFKQLKNEGVIRPETKFQVDLVPAHSVIWLFLIDALHAAIDPIYNDALRGEIDKIAAAIPHDELAIQFDVASAVFARLERNEASNYGRTKDETLDTFVDILVDLGNRVPQGVDLLYHLCYGDSNHRHVIEPTDMGDMVDLVNRLSRRINRPIQLVHMPVPRNRKDKAYFRPLEKLEITPPTKVSLGLVHYTDGVSGTRDRIRAAEKFLSEFSIATECGFGRRDPATIPELMRIHVESAKFV